MSAPRLSGTEIRSRVMRLPAVPFDYFPDEVLTKANRVSKNDDGGNVELNGRFNVFGLPGRAYGKEKRIFLSEEELHAAHTYILLNCEEVDEYVRLYDGELKMKHPGITDKDIEINRAKGFALWIKDKALAVESTIPANVLALAMGPDRDQVSRNGYKVNGYDFHTKSYGLSKRTTNSDGGDDPQEIDPQLILVSDNEEEEELLTDTDTDLENEEDDGYESAREDDSDSDNNTY
ncbi:hypothetical protein POM88_019593 [Heracleum sosnowskyi]|uniref:Uncharacterized protein n=1 Tax=Heracleum sosnowskyi TaxID=360622 RepID=A0AAD8MS20_9APIA|nr:hypothetical protein POM88_019593 [Heracleum sosnowskyi]